MTRYSRDQIKFEPHPHGSSLVVFSFGPIKPPLTCEYRRPSSLLACRKRGARIKNCRYLQAKPPFAQQDLHLLLFLLTNQNRTSITFFHKTTAAAAGLPLVSLYPLHGSIFHTSSLAPQPFTLGARDVFARFPISFPEYALRLSSETGIGSVPLDKGDDTLCSRTARSSVSRYEALYSRSHPLS